MRSPRMGTREFAFLIAWVCFTVAFQKASWAVDHWVPFASETDPGTWEIHWTRGCSPTSAAMVLAYWDKNFVGYDRLVDYWADYTKRSDGTGEIMNAPNVVEELRLRMGTCVDGSTPWDNILPGILATTNIRNGYAFTPFRCKAGLIDHCWPSVVGSITAGVPFVWSVASGLGPEASAHSLAAFGYSDDKYVITHNTWNVGWDRWHYSQYDNNGIDTKWQYVDAPMPGGGNASHLTLDNPNGGCTFDGTGGVTLTGGNWYDIWWTNHGAEITSVQLFYSSDASRWTSFTGELPAAADARNCYTWTIPNIHTHKLRVRINGYNAAGALVAVDGSRVNNTITRDVTKPTGSVVINGDAAYTNSTAVNLTLSAVDTQNRVEMCISNSGTCNLWEPYSTSKSWTLNPGSGQRYVYARFRDSVGNNSILYFDTIILNPSVTVTSPDSAVNWGVGSVRAITWSHNLGAGRVFKIEVSRNYGATGERATWETITPAYTNPDPTSGTYNWTVTGPVTTTARVRVSCAIMGASDISNADFAVADPFITVTSPNSAVNWGVGSVQPIKWSDNLGPGKAYKIELSRDEGATWETITASTPGVILGGGSYNWAVAGPVTRTARVRVSCPSMGASDTSDVNFTIAKPFIWVTSPNSAVNWGVGSVQTITWSHNLGARRAFKIELSRNGGFNWETILESAISPSVATGSFPLTVTGPLTTTARVRVSCTGMGVSDTSDVNFTIANPFIRVTSPNSAVNCGVGSVQTITWSHNLGARRAFKIELSRNDGFIWETIIASAFSPSVASGSYKWTVTGPVTTAARVRVSCASPVASDISDKDFAITGSYLGIGHPPLFFDGFSDGDFTAPFRTAGEEAGAGEAVPGDVTWTVEPEKGI